MRKKDKFIYNTQTLSYEKIVVTWQQRLLQIIEYGTAVLVVSIVLVLLHNKFFPTAKEAALEREIDQIELQYAQLVDEMDSYSKIMDNYRQRENNVYRMVFEMEPMDEYVWESGVGGSDKYEKFKNFRSKDIMTEAAGKVDKLGRQLAMQSQSLDEIRDMAGEKEEMLNSIPSIRPIGKLSRRIKLYSGYGMRIHPIHKIKKMHYGIDFTAPKGTPIYATGNGRIHKVTKSRSGYGNRVVIDHSYGYKTMYAHMKDINVKRGQKVKKGDVIGTVGNTGTSTAPHLHYEVLHKGKKINPIHFCLDGLTPEEYNEMLDMASVVNQSFDGGGEESASK